MTILHVFTMHSALNHVFMLQLSKSNVQTGPYYQQKYKSFDFTETSEAIKMVINHITACTGHRNIFCCC